MSSLRVDSKNAHHSPGTKIYQGTSFTSIGMFHTHTHTYIYTYNRIITVYRTYIRTYGQIYACIFIKIYISIYLSICRYIYLCIFIYVFIYAHTHTIYISLSAWAPRKCVRARIPVHEACKHDLRSWRSKAALFMRILLSSKFSSARTMHTVS